MSLHDELLDAARSLLRRNHGRPTQGDIRRSISTAYYALFHRLIEDGVTHLASGASDREVIGRAFGHTDMKKICQQLQKSPLPPQVTPLFGMSVPAELKNVATAFIELQELRHKADYDRSEQFDKSDGQNTLGRAETAFADWERVRTSSAGQIFLLLLLLGDRWNRG